MRFVIRTPHPPYTSKRPWSIPVSISGWAALPWTRRETSPSGSALRAAISFRACTLRDVLRPTLWVQCQARSCYSMAAARSSVRSNAGATTAACQLIRRMIVRSGTPTSTTPRPVVSTGAHELALLSSIAAKLTEDNDKLSRKNKHITRLFSANTESVPRPLLGSNPLGRSTAFTGEAIRMQFSGTPHQGLSCKKFTDDRDENSHLGFEERFGLVIQLYRFLAGCGKTQFAARLR